MPSKTNETHASKKKELKEPLDRAKRLKPLYTPKKVAVPFACAHVRADRTDRTFVLLPKPSQDSPKWVWRRNYVDDLRSMHAYFRSTGESGYFPGTFFPTDGMIKERHRGTERWWISKLNVKHHHWMRGSGWKRKLGELWLSVHPKRFEELAEEFLDYFDSWYHVQQSAQLGGPMWKRPDMRYLRDMAFLYDWDEMANAFVARKVPLEPITFRRAAKSKGFCAEFTDYHDLQQWIKNHGADATRMWAT